ncbi:hypothetical protein [Microbacterium sp. GCS4]|uniref:hypothetical protein n=1 Tax=Microbacterium sp. GCS4 TaxID=1692239 RepID=UPI000680B047|nr:hypothetical protein [Microbacterium sp. GCS4]KNY06866.1 hypothetical protein AKH00_00550 [Microbacterium sp. GCS4]
MLRVSAYSSSELLTVLRGLRNLDRETKKQLRRNLKQIAEQAWKQTLAQHASTKLERAVLADSGRVRVSDQNVRLTSASLSRSLVGGLKPSESFGPVEFGANPRPGSTETVRSRRGNEFSRKRDPNRPFKAPNRRGYVVYPSAASVIPRILAMYVQTFVRAIHEALEGKSS